MIVIVLVFALLGSLGLTVGLISQGDIFEAAKALTAAFGIFVLLAARVGIYRVTHARR